MGLCVLILALFVVPAFAQDEPATADVRVDPAVINLKITEVEGSTSLEETVASTLLDLYRRALTNLDRSRLELANAEAIAKAGAEAPDELEKTLQEIEKLRASSAEQTLRISTRAELPELEQSLTDEKAALIDARSRVAELREQYTRDVARPNQARERLGKARSEREAALSEASSPAPLGEAASITEARLWNLDARAQRLSNEIRKLEQEILTQDIRLELSEARQELGGLQLERARTRARMLEDAISERLTAEAEQAREDAQTTQQKLEDQHPLVREFAIENVELSGKLTQRNRDIEEASNERDEIRQDYTHLSEQLDSTKSKLAIAGMNRAMGQLLVDQRRTLPNDRVLKRQAADRKREVSRVGLEQINLSEQRRDLLDIGAVIDELTGDLSEELASAIRSDLQPLTESRLELVIQSLDAGGRYMRVLGELEMSQQQLIDAVADYRKYLDSTLLWVKNTSPVNESVLTTLPDDIAQLVSPADWKHVLSDLARVLRANLVVVLILVVLLGLGLMRSWFLARIDESSKYVGRITLDRFSYSVKALVYTLLASAPLPLVLILGALAIQLDEASAAFSFSVASQAIVVALDLLIIQFYIDGCREKGLLPVHCDWAESAVSDLRKQLRWFIVVFPVSRFIGETSFLLDAGGQIGGVAVLGTVVSATALGLLVYRVFASGTGPGGIYLGKNPRSLVAQTRPVWAVLVTLVVPFLMVLWLAGYNYTGHVLAISFMYSFWLILSLLVFQRLLARWLTLGYQKLEYQAAIERRDAARAARRAAREAEEGGDSGEDEDSDAEEPLIDFVGLSDDSRKLVRTFVVFVAIGWLWVIWAPVIPALTVMGETALWSRTNVLDGEMVQVPVTLGHVLWAIVIAIAAGAAARGLPALLELFLLQRTSMKVGGRYTATTLLRWSIIGAGVIIVIGMLGISWSKAQWLVAALGVGIGFGLQEIVANFISGLVLLFERPIRVGDMVTVGETSGTVTRMQIRATTIRDFDHRELLVPNKEFITGRLLNWSLSDDIIRAIIPVGIAYGSDVELALRLLDEIAREHEEVLDDPSPSVFFEEFGDSALNLSLRVHLPSADNRLSVKSKLLESINKKFSEAGIVVAFPQRDIHLTTSQPLEVQMKPAPE